MPAQFFKKEAKPSLFKPKTIFKHKNLNKNKAAKKEPPKRVFRARKITFWTIFCATVLFPLVLKVVRAANITGQHGMAVTTPGTSPAGAAGAAAAGVVGAAGAVAAGSMGAAALLPGTFVMGVSVFTTGAASISSIGAAATFAAVMSAIPVIGWIILAVVIIALAVLMALSMAGVISCDSCSTCGGQQAVAGQSPTSMDTTGVQQGANQQASYGS